MSVKFTVGMRNRLLIGLYRLAAMDAIRRFFGPPLDSIRYNVTTRRNRGFREIQIRYIDFICNGLRIAVTRSFVDL